MLMRYSAKRSECACRFSIVIKFDEVLLVAEEELGETGPIRLELRTPVITGEASMPPAVAKLNTFESRFELLAPGILLRKDDDAFDGGDLDA